MAYTSHKRPIPTCVAIPYLSHLSQTVYEKYGIVKIWGMLGLHPLTVGYG